MEEQFMDEFIVNMIEQNKKNQEDQDRLLEDMIEQIKNLHVSLNELDMDMTESLFFDGEIKMRIPADFIKMPAKAAKVKYPVESRPQIIYMDKKDSVNIGLNHTQENVKEEDVVSVRDYMIAAYSAVNPASKITDKGHFMSGEHAIAYYSFENFVIGGQMYNLVFILSLKGKLFACNLNCLKKDTERMKPLFYGIMKTTEAL
ncbi:MAG: hypothetical protein LBL35_01170 [Clostridiales bacterium]|nr:hypothetical protein [Clostridiales bacterium]